MRCALEGGAQLRAGLRYQAGARGGAHLLAAGHHRLPGGGAGGAGAGLLHRPGDHRARLEDDGGGARGGPGGCVPQPAWM